MLWSALARSELRECFLITSISAKTQNSVGVLCESFSVLNYLITL